MSVLSATFKGVDEISSIFDRMANSGARAIDQWENANNMASTAFEQTASGAESVARAAQSAVSATDNWTDAVGNYDKSMLEAVYSTEKLVDMGFKTEEALSAEAQAASEIADAFQKSLQVTEEFITTNEQLEAELQELQNAYIGTAIQCGKNSEEAKTLQKEIGELSKIVDQNKQEFADLEKEAGCATGTMSGGIEQLEQVMLAAGIAKLVGEITGAVIDMTNEFSNAEVIIAKATGATGAALDDLNDSMMRLYANDDDALSEVAGIVGELNTRLQLQGPALENVTSLFQDYTQATGEQGVASVQSVTKVMKNWNVEIDETENLLDKLVIAGQMSGASVGSLSDMVVMNKATLQQLGYGLEESIALLAMMEYEGLNASSVMMGLRSAVTEFSNDGKDASVAMQETIDKIGSMAAESEATALAIETFGSRAGAELAYAIRNGKFEIEDWIASVGDSEGTLAKTAAAATTLEERWEQASNKVNAAFTNVLAPSVDGISTAFAELVGETGDFLDEHPALTAGLIGLGVSLGIVAAAYATYTVATTIATAVTKAFGAEAMIALWPLYLVAAAIGAVVAVAVILSNAVDDADAEFNSLTATSKEHYTAMRNIEDEYESVAAEQGRTSAAALELAGNLEVARIAYESNKETMQEFIAKNDEIIESIGNTIETFHASMEGIDAEERKMMALAMELDRLSSAPSISAGEQQQMVAYIEKLNEMLPNLALTYEDVANSSGNMMDTIMKVAEADALDKRIQAGYDALTQAIMDQTDAQTQLDKATANTTAATKQEELALAELTQLSGLADSSRGFKPKALQEAEDAYEAAQKNLQAYEEEENRLAAALDDCNNFLEENKQQFEEVARAVEEAANAPVTYEEAVNSAVKSVAEDMETLVKSYDDAYAAAYNSIDSTIGLFNKMATETDLSTKDMTESMTSQMNFLSTYSENLRKAVQYGIDDGLIASLSDGSKESAGQIDAIIAEFERLGGESSKEAETFVENFNNQFKGVQAAKDEFAAQVADMQTNFSSEMDKIEGHLADTIEKMTMEADAAAAAKDTIQAYIDQIKSMTDEAHNAGTAVSKAAINALASNGVNISGLPGVTDSVGRGYATGTSAAAPGLALVGEKGPELINFGGGEVVYTTDETNRILAATDHISTDINVPDSISPADNEHKAIHTEEKKITLDINGSGSMGISGGMDKNSVLEILVENVKPILMNIIDQEIFEEGDLAHEF